MAGLNILCGVPWGSPVSYETHCTFTAATEMETLGDCRPPWFNRDFYLHLASIFASLRAGDYCTYVGRDKSGTRGDRCGISHTVEEMSFSAREETMLSLFLSLVSLRDDAGWFLSRFLCCPCETISCKLVVSQSSLFFERKNGMYRFALVLIQVLPWQH